MPDRRGFLVALAAIVAAPWMPKPFPTELRGCTFAEWEAAGRIWDSHPLYWREEWLLWRLARMQADIADIEMGRPPVRTTNGLMLLSEEARRR